MIAHLQQEGLLPALEVLLAKPKSTSTAPAPTTPFRAPARNREPAAGRDLLGRDLLASPSSSRASTAPSSPTSSPVRSSFGSPASSYHGSPSRSRLGSINSISSTSVSHLASQSKAGSEAGSKQVTICLTKHGKQLLQATAGTSTATGGSLLLSFLQHMESFITPVNRRSHTLDLSRGKASQTTAASVAGSAGSTQTSGLRIKDPWRSHQQAVFTIPAAGTELHPNSSPAIMAGHLMAQKLCQAQAVQRSLAGAKGSASVHQTAAILALFGPGIAQHLPVVTAAGLSSSQPLRLSHGSIPVNIKRAFAPVCKELGKTISDIIPQHLLMPAAVSAQQLAAAGPAAATEPGGVAEVMAAPAAKTMGDEGSAGGASADTVINLLAALDAAAPAPVAAPAAPPAPAAPVLQGSKAASPVASLPASSASEIAPDHAADEMAPAIVLTAGLDAHSVPSPVKAARAADQAQLIRSPAKDISPTSRRNISSDDTSEQQAEAQAAEASEGIPAGMPVGANALAAGCNSPAAAASTARLLAGATASVPRMLPPQLATAAAPQAPRAPAAAASSGQEEEWEAAAAAAAAARRRKHVADIIEPNDAPEPQQQSSAELAPARQPATARRHITVRRSSNTGAVDAAASQKAAVEAPTGGGMASDSSLVTSPVAAMVTTGIQQAQAAGVVDAVGPAAFSHSSDVPSAPVMPVLPTCQAAAPAPLAAALNTATDLLPSEHATGGVSSAPSLASRSPAPAGLVRRSAQAARAADEELATKTQDHNSSFSSCCCTSSPASRTHSSSAVTAGPQPDAAEEDATGAAASGTPVSPVAPAAAAAASISQSTPHAPSLKHQAVTAAVQAEALAVAAQPQTAVESEPGPVLLLPEHEAAGAVETPAMLRKRLTPQDDDDDDGSEPEQQQRSAAAPVPPFSASQALRHRYRVTVRRSGKTASTGTTPARASSMAAPAVAGVAMTSPAVAAQEQSSAVEAAAAAAAAAAVVVAPVTNVSAGPTAPAADLVAPAAVVPTPAAAAATILAAGAGRQLPPQQGISAQEDIAGAALAFAVSIPLAQASVTPVSSASAGAGAGAGAGAAHVSMGPLEAAAAAAAAAGTASTAPAAAGPVTAHVTQPEAVSALGLPGQVPLQLTGSAGQATASSPARRIIKVSRAPRSAVASKATRLLAAGAGTLAASIAGTVQPSAASSLELAAPSSQATAHAAAAQQDQCVTAAPDGAAAAQLHVDPAAEAEAEAEQAAPAVDPAPQLHAIKHAAAATAVPPTDPASPVHAAGRHTTAAATPAATQQHASVVEAEHNAAAVPTKPGPEQVSTGRPASSSSHPAVAVPEAVAAGHDKPAAPAGAAVATEGVAIRLRISVHEEGDDAASVTVALLPAAPAPEAASAAGPEAMICPAVAAEPASEASAQGAHAGATTARTDSGPEGQVQPAVAEQAVSATGTVVQDAPALAERLVTLQVAICEHAGSREPAVQVLIAAVGAEAQGAADNCALPMPEAADAAEPAREEEPALSSPPQSPGGDLVQSVLPVDLPAVQVERHPETMSDAEVPPETTSMAQQQGTTDTGQSAATEAPPVMADSPAVLAQATAPAEVTPSAPAAAAVTQSSQKAHAPPASGTQPEEATVPRSATPGGDTSLAARMSPKDTSAANAAAGAQPLTTPAPASPTPRIQVLADDAAAAAPVGHAAVQQDRSASRDADRDLMELLEQGWMGAPGQQAEAGGGAGRSAGQQAVCDDEDAGARASKLRWWNTRFK